MSNNKNRNAVERLISLLCSEIKSKISNNLSYIQGISNITVDAPEKSVSDELFTLNNNINSLESKVNNVRSKIYNTFKTPFVLNDNLTSYKNKLTSLRDKMANKILELYNYDESVNQEVLFSSNIKKLSYTLSFVEKEEGNSKYLSLPVTRINLASRPIVNERDYSGYVVRYIYNVNISSLPFKPSKLIFFCTDDSTTNQSVFTFYEIESYDGNKLGKYKARIKCYTTSSDSISNVNITDENFNLNFTQSLSSILVFAKYTTATISNVNCIAVE